ncbi:hypothetical protein SAMN05216252_12138 [Actinacidiphila glaucinigra]|uniref:Uncharacterized protein n=1 Tax=Actinacidiphila glaucinigra TaxID=235986 RepID=A0A239LUN2_9ACTN|nr:hypothetical protein SAMN05216252_12138 [Actinacidiphila glaucinigra]
MDRMDALHDRRPWRRAAGRGVKRVGFGLLEIRNVDWFAAVQAHDVSRGQRPRDPRVVMSHEFQRVVRPCGERVQGVGVVDHTCDSPRRAVADERCCIGASQVRAEGHGLHCARHTHRSCGGPLALCDRLLAIRPQQKQVTAVCPCEGSHITDLAQHVLQASALAPRVDASEVGPPAAWCDRLPDPQHVLVQVGHGILVHVPKTRSVGSRTNSHRCHLRCLGCPRNHIRDTQPIAEEGRRPHDTAPGP